ncbi:MAG: MFS transporter [Aestuariivirgaceae bacterium]|nr:MFS transporter [Aestuariivirgaceae bacterium]
MSGQANQWRNLIAASAAVCVFSFSMGEMYPLLALKMEGWGTAPWVIGLNSAMSPIGILVAGLFISKLAHAFGPKRVAMVMALATGLILLCYPTLPSLPAWFALRFLQGACVATLFSLSEAWVVRFAHGQYRARVTAVYAAVISGSFGLGAGVLGFTGIEGYLPFMVGALVIFCAIPLIALVQDDEVLDEESHISFFRFAPKAPMLLFAIAVHAIFDGAMIGFFAVYAVSHGYGIALAAWTVTALALGNVVLQLPLGWLADHMSKRAVMAGCFVVCGGGMLVIEPLMDTVWIWPMLAVLGAAGFGIYSVGLAMLGDRFTGSDLVAGTTAFSSMWGLGALAGSVLAGVAMDMIGPEGLPLSMFGVFMVYLLALAVFGLRQRRVVA